MKKPVARVIWIALLSAIVSTGFAHCVPGPCIAMLAVPKPLRFKQQIQTGEQVAQGKTHCLFPLPRYLNYYFYSKNLNLKTTDFCHVSQIQQYHFCRHGHCPSASALFKAVEAAGGMTDNQILQLAKLMAKHKDASLLQKNIHTVAPA